MPEEVVVEPNGNGSAAPVDYMAMKPVDILPADFKVPYQGKDVLAKDVPFFSETKSLKDLITRGYENHRAMGSAIKLPGNNAKPEEYKAFLDKMIGSVPRDTAAALLKDNLRTDGKLAKFPEAPDKYEIKAPETWGELKADDPMMGKARAWAHKHEVSQEALKELTDIYFDSHKDVMPAFKELEGILPVLKEGKEALQKKFDERVRANGQDPEVVAATIGRYAAKRFSKEDIDMLGDAGNHPAILQMMYDLALAEGESMSELARPEERTTEKSDAEKELDIIHTPGTPQNLIWLERSERGQEMQRRASELYKQITGGK